MTAPTLTTVVTYLEMLEPPKRPLVPPPPKLKLALLRAETPSVAFSRFLYDTTGRPWWWYERKEWSDERLSELIQHERYDTYVLYLAGTPAGYFELDRIDPAIVELAYFGIMPEFIGQRLGPYLLDQAIQLAWAGPPAPRRVWVNTCDLDHPRALPLYQRAGFAPYDRKVKEFEDPRPKGLVDPGPIPNR